MSNKREVKYSMSLENKTKKQFKQAEDNWKSLEKTVKNVTTGIAIAAAAGLAATVRSIEKLDSTAKAAERTGFGAEKLQELRFAADQSGTSVGILDSALGRFTKRLGLARAGTGAAAKTYSDLNIDLTQTSDVIFDQVVNSLAAMDDETNRIAITTRMFGDDAQRLELMLRGGTAGLEAYAKEAHSLGLVFSDELLKSAEDAGDQLSIMKQVLDAQFTRAFIELAPAVTSLGHAFAEAAPHIAAFVDGLVRAQEDWSSNTLKNQIAVIDGQIDYLSNKLQEELSGEATTIDIGIGTITNPFKAIGDILGDGVDHIADSIRNLTVEKEKLEALLGKSIKSDFLSAAEDSAESIITDILSLNEAVDANKLFNPDAAKKDKVTELFVTSIAEMEKTLALLDKTTNLEKILWETQSGRYKDLSENQKKALITAAALIDAKESEISSTESLDENNKLLDKQAEKWKLLIDPTIAIQNKITELNRLLQAGKISADEYASGIEHIANNIDPTEMQDLWEDVGDTMASAFEDAILSGKSLSDVIKGLEKDILRMVTRKLVTEPLSQMIASFIPKFFHDGGLASSAGSSSRSVSPSVFMGARRYHDGGIPGLRMNEVPAILEESEEVITRSDPRHRLNGSGSSVNVTNNFIISNPASRETQQQIAAKSGASISRAIRRGS